MSEPGPSASGGSRNWSSTSERTTGSSPWSAASPCVPDARLSRSTSSETRSHWLLVGSGSMGTSPGDVLLVKDFEDLAVQEQPCPFSLTPGRPLADPHDVGGLFPRVPGEVMVLDEPGPIGMLLPQPLERYPKGFDLLRALVRRLRQVLEA